MENEWDKDGSAADYLAALRNYEGKEVPGRGEKGEGKRNQIRNTAVLVNAQTSEEHLHMATRLFHELSIGHKPYWEQEPIRNIASVPIPMGHWFHRTNNGITCHIAIQDPGALDFRVVLPFSDSAAGCVYYPTKNDF